MHEVNSLQCSWLCYNYLLAGFNAIKSIGKAIPLRLLESVPVVDDVQFALCVIVAIPGKLITNL